jgi:hypothetical protein
MASADAGFRKYQHKARVTSQNMNLKLNGPLWTVSFTLVLILAYIF